MRTASTPLVDCHVHVGLTKYRPVEEYLADMARHGVTGAVLVQHLGNTDNDYLAAQLDEPGLAAVALVRDSTQAADVLSRGFRGVRLGPEGLPGEPESDRIWKVLAEHGAVASITGPFSSVASPDFFDLVQRFEDITFRLEHLGWFRYADDAPPYPAFSRLLKLADLPNTTTTWSGFFVNSSCAYPYPDALPYLRMSLAAFGAERIMWSGDWNRADLADGDYPAAIEHVASLPFLDDAQRHAILAGTAARYFRIDQKRG